MRPGIRLSDRRETDLARAPEGGAVIQTSAPPERYSAFRASLRVKARGNHGRHLRAGEDKIERPTLHT